MREAKKVCGPYNESKDQRSCHGWPRAHGRENVGVSVGSSWRFVGIGVHMRIVSSAVERDCRMLGPGTAIRIG